MGILAKNIGPEQGFNEFGRWRVVNNTGDTINKGDIVYISGASYISENALPEIALAEAGAGVDGAARRLKIASHRIEDGAVGEVVDWMWFVPESSAGSAGDPLYLSNTAGEYSTSPGTVSRKVGEVISTGAPGELVFLCVTGFVE
jgi:hypothetical protein